MKIWTSQKARKVACRKLSAPAKAWTPSMKKNSVDQISAVVRTPPVAVNALVKVAAIVVAAVAAKAVSVLARVNQQPRNRVTIKGSRSSNRVVDATEPVVATVRSSAATTKVNRRT